MLFESERVRVRARFPRDAGTRLDDTDADGFAWLAVRVFDAGEVVPKEHDHARPVARWLERLAPGEPLRSRPPALFRTDRRGYAAVVPRQLLEGLAPDTIIAVDWEFEPRG